MNVSLVIPVPLLSARAWAHGWIGDFELMTGPQVPEAVYICTLPDIGAWRAVLPSLVQFHRAGAVAFILRTKTPAVVRHIVKWGAIPTIQDPSGGWRYWAGPGVVGRYFGRAARERKRLKTKRVTRRANDPDQR